MARLLIQHPSCPLPFEGSGAIPSGLPDNNQSTLLPPQVFDERWDALFKSPNMAKAAKMALQAYQVREPFMVREVFAACVRVSEGVCPEAYNLLATKTAGSHQEALALYLKAEELCPLLTDEYEAVCRAGNLWSSAPQLHSYVRAVLGSANTLRKMGRLEEALLKYKRLIEVESSTVDDQYLPNYRYHVPQLMIQMGDWDAAERFMLLESRKHHSALLSEDSSSMLPWVWTMALLSYHRVSVGGSVGYPVGPYQPDCYVDNFMANTIVFSALELNTHVLPLLKAGASEQPPASYPADPGSREQAIAYAHDSFDLWRANPLAIEWVHRCWCTRRALRELADGEEVGAAESWSAMLRPKPALDIFEMDWRERHGLVKRETCQAVFSELDLDGDDAISAVEMKLWFEKVISKVPPEDLPHHLVDLAATGTMPKWIEAVNLMDLDDDELITYAEFWRFWSLPKPGVFLELPSVTSRGESFLRVLTRSPKSRASHLKVVLDVVLQEGVPGYRELLLEAVSTLVLHDDRQDLLEVMVSYNAELRGLIVRNLTALVHCAAVQGSWQALSLFLGEFISLRRPEQLLEVLRHVLRSKAYFTVGFRNRGNSVRFDTAGLAPVAANHSWCKCVDALVSQGLGPWCLQEALQMLADPGMSKLVRKLLKNDTQKTQPSNAKKPVPVKHRPNPIGAAPCSPPPFERWDSSCNALRIAEQLYEQPPPALQHREEPKEGARQWHRLHPLYIHLLHRFEEDGSCLAQDILSDKARAAAELRALLEPDE